MFSDMLNFDFGGLTTFGYDGKGDCWSEGVVPVFLWQIILPSNDPHSYISSFGKIKILQNLPMGTVLRVYLVLLMICEIICMKMSRLVHHTFW